MSRGKARAGKSRSPAPVARDYQALAEFRHLLRLFLAFSKTAAERSGLTPQQHQALLAIKGFGADSGLTVGQVAGSLLIRHHSAVELVDRLMAAGLVSRTTDPDDRRRVRIKLTGRAEARLRDLSAAHLAELRAAKPSLIRLLSSLAEEQA